LGGLFELFYVVGVVIQKYIRFGFDGRHIECGFVSTVVIHFGLLFG
jgi:hypothetical protein